MHEARGVLNALILEDEPRYRGFLTEVLRDMDCAPMPASTADDAMKLVHASPPDILVLDLNLPFIDGITFLEQFRRRCPDAPVVIITGFGDLESARKAIRLGVTDFLTKPCDLGQIEQAIDRARRRILRADPVLKDGPSSLGAKRAPEGVRSLEAIERDAILEALRTTGGNRSAAARMLGISRRAIYNKIEEYRHQGIDVP